MVDGDCCNTCNCCCPSCCCCCCVSSRSEGRRESGSMPFARNSPRMRSAVEKSLSRFACTHRSNWASVSWSRPPAPLPTGTCWSGGRRWSGSIPTVRNSERMESALAQSFSRFASTHLSSLDSTAGSSTAVLAPPTNSLSGGRTKSGSMPIARNSLRRVSAVAQSLSRFASTQRSSFSSVAGSNLEPANMAGPKPEAPSSAAGVVGDPGGSTRSAGRTTSGSMPTSRSSERIESAREKSFSRLASTHLSSWACTSGAMGMLPSSRSGGRTVSGSMP
mmetsp:Transcript_71721/g.233159  ORF Transcript_71721/g.233159 Transcript_71721/m.233159 type:complete len:276 (+) Transcript_71721:3209-4036(+)